MQYFLSLGSNINAQKNIKFGVSELKEIFLDLQVIKIRGDWTKSNPKIKKFLQDNNRYGIPFNIIYNKNNLDGIILPEILSRKKLKEILYRL